MLPLFLGVFLVYYAFAQLADSQIREIKNQFTQVSYFYLTCASFFTSVSIWARAHRWNYSLKYLGHTPKSSTSFMAVCIGYLINYTVPRLGEISRALVLNKYEKIPFNKAIGSIVSERIVDLFCLVFCVLTALILEKNIILNFISHHISIGRITSSAGILLLLVLAIYLFLNTKAVPFIEKIKKKVIEFISGALSLFQMPHKFVFLALTLIIWTSYILTFYFGTKSLPATSAIDFKIIFIAFVIGSFAVSFTNGGLGAFPLAISELLFLYDVPKTAGTALGWIIWSSQTFLYVLLGLCSLIFLPLLNKNKGSYGKG